MEKYPDPEKVREAGRLMETAAKQIQVKLIELSLEDGKSRFDQSFDWINQNASIFRRAFNELLKEHPELVEEWNPEKDISISSPSDESGRNTETRIEIKDTPEREKIIKMVRKEMDYIKEGELGKAA